MATAPRTVDDLDHELVERLRGDGRARNRSLAAALGVTEATVAARLRRLAEDGVMRIVAVADAPAFGLHTMGFAFVRVGDRSPHEVAAAVAQIGAAIGVNVCSGPYPVLATLMAEDLAGLSDVLRHEVAAIPGVVSVRIEIVVEALRFDTRWSGRAGLHQGDLPGPVVPSDRSALDVAIVGALQRDARVSNRRIAGELGVSEATVRVRLRRLEAEGALRIQAVCDVEHFGLRAIGFVSVRAVPGRSAEAAAALLAEPELGFAARTIGSRDFVGFVAAADRDRLLEVAMVGLAGHPAIAEVELYEGWNTLKHLYCWSLLGAEPWVAG